MESIEKLGVFDPARVLVSQQEVPVVIDVAYELSFPIARNTGNTRVTRPCRWKTGAEVYV